MADTIVVAENFDLGFKTDISRAQLPRGAAYRLKDYIPQLEAPIRGRGGWSYGSKALSDSGGTQVHTVGWFPYTKDPHLVAMNDSARVYTLKNPSSTDGTLITTVANVAPQHPPIYHYLAGDEILVFTPAFATNTAPRKYYDTTGALVYGVTTLPGTPPNAAVGASWGEYLILANGYVGGTRFSNRLWWSEPGDHNTWNTGTSFWGLPIEVIRIVPMQNLILCFGHDETWILVGDTPPPGGNLEERLIFPDNGCMDARSVAQYKEWVVWANSGGVWKTDGSTLTDVTFRSGISSYWRDLVGDFNWATGWKAAGGILYGHYIISIHDNTGAEVVVLAFDLEREIVFELTNFPAQMFARRSSGPGTATTSGHEELFFGSLNSTRVGYLSSCWDPAGAAVGMQDANGVNVLPQLETPFWTLNAQGEKRIRRAYLSYGLGNGGANPTLNVGFTTSPEKGAAYTTAAEVLMPTASVVVERPKRVYINRKALGVGLKITQTNRSTDTRLHTIEIEGHGLGVER